MRKILNSFFLLFIIFISEGIYPTVTIANVLFSDSFTGIDGTHLQDHNNLWRPSVEGFSDLLIQNNQLKFPGVNNTAYILDGFFGQTDQCASLDVSFPLSSFIGITVRINQQRSSYYNFSIQPNGIIQLVSQNQLLSSKNELISNGIHNLKICAINNRITTYIDSIQVLSTTDFTNISGSSEFGTGNIGGSILDNYLYTDGSELSNVSVHVPTWKQTDTNWINQTYDHAERWNPKDPSIGAWGCALTSAAMVLNYYNIVKLPDTSFLTPSSLNRWLNSQKDGYVRNGEVNWLAISRLSKIAKATGLNPDFDFDALEFNRRGAHSQDILKDDLTNNQPDILQVPGHFVVAKGTQDNTFLINDPFYNYDSLDQGYNNTYLALNRFIPSNTDLSYFFAVGNENLILKLKNNLGDELGNSFQQFPIENPNDPNQKNNPPLNEHLYQHPETGMYSFEIIGDSTSVYKLDLFAYDQNGNPLIKSVEGLIGKDKKEVFTINFDKDNASNSAFIRYVTLSTLEDDIQEAIDLKQIDKNLGKNLLNQTKTISKLSSKKNSSFQMEIRLKQIQIVLNTAKEKLVQNDAFTVLSSDITSLLTTY